MSKFYEIKASSVDSPPDGMVAHNVKLQGKDKIERLSGESPESDVFASSTVALNSLSGEIISKIKTAFKMLGTPRGVQFWIVALVKMFTYYTVIDAPFFRGYRLEIVRRGTVGESNWVPSLNLQKIVRYYRSGLVLIFSRYVYFLPLLFVSFFSGVKMLWLVVDIGNFIWDKFWGTENLSYAEFIVIKVIPQFSVDFLIQLVVLTLYLVLVWPIYRIIAIRYAAGLCSGRDFFRLGEMRIATRIFLRNASLVYSIYSFVLVIDVFIVLYFIFATSTIILIVTIPAVNMLLKYWLKGYAYGKLGAKLFPPPSSPSRTEYV